MQVSSSFDRDDFLRNYWQRQPCLLQGFFTDWLDPLDADELAGLALEDEIEARLVLGSAPESWQIKRGPFTETDFTSLPHKDWTLLVQALDQWLPEIKQLKQKFGFIPSWRIEDIMVSFASPGGGVGPHFDHYDVFLCQGLGRRHWRLGQRCDEQTPTRDCQGLAILQSFEQQSSYELQAGDVLYVPAGIAHWGEAEENSLSYSLGCRAPSYREVLLTAADLFSRDFKESQRATGIADPQSEGEPGEICASQLLDDFESILQSNDLNGKLLEAMAILASEPKYPEKIVPPEQPWAAGDLPGLVAEGIDRNPHSRFVFIVDGDGGGEGEVLTLFADAYPYQLDPGAAPLVRALCADQPLDSGFLTEITAACPAAARLLLDLLNEGSLLAPESP